MSLGSASWELMCLDVKLDVLTSASGLYVARSQAWDPSASLGVPGRPDFLRWISRLWFPVWGTGMDI